MAWDLGFEIIHPLKYCALVVMFVFPELSWGHSTRNDPQDHQPNSWDHSYLSNIEQSELRQAKGSDQAGCLHVL